MRDTGNYISNGKVTTQQNKYVVLIASAKIPEREGSISPSRFYG